MRTGAVLDMRYIMQGLLRVKPLGSQIYFSRAGAMWHLNVIVCDVDYCFNKLLRQLRLFFPLLDSVGHSELWESRKEINLTKNG